MRLSELAKICGADVVRGANVEVKSVTIDSRKANRGCAFVACPGATPSSKGGHEFIRSAIHSDADVVVCQPAYADDVAELAVATVDDPRRFVAMAAEILNGSPSKSLTIIGVTGTNGKTTVSFLLAEMLEALGKKAAVFGTLGIGAPGASQPMGYTTPEAEVLSARLADLRDEGFEYVCMEVSSHALATARADGIHFSVAAFTNFSQDHLDFHPTMEHYLDAKLRLFGSLLPKEGWAVVPKRPAEAFSNAKDAGTHLRVVGDKDGLHVVNVSQNLEGMQLTLVDGEERALVKAPLFGGFNAENILLAAGIGLSLGFDLSDVAEGLSAVKGVPGRMERVGTEGPCVLVDFAHTPDALKAALLACRGAVAEGGKLVVVFGAGGDRDPSKRALMGREASLLADEVWLTSDNPRSEDPQLILNNIKEGCVPDFAPIHVESDRALAIGAALASLDPRDVVLIAGKGDERFQTIAGEKLPFVDREVALRALEIRE
ncbi:MAG: UDP-N-acetylmuramoyl-L-alanyl-D-glutamate--2,6-diaminopimelate ligase [Deltaproteobacteria bacterium]|nr:UDP-N-acetylmuramoyl-L-alanyl-D-glutamate--2,6-diaminopimelate ligase [Deltaproteobacteria bacterium]